MDALQNVNRTGLRFDAPVVVVFADDTGAVSENSCRVLEGSAFRQDLVYQSMAETMRDRFLNATLSEYGFEGSSYSLSVGLTGSKAVPEKLSAIAGCAFGQRKAFERLLHFRIERQPDRIAILLRPKKDGIAHWSVEVQVGLPHLKYAARSNKKW
jgi:hypothetical protein